MVVYCVNKELERGRAKEKNDSLTVILRGLKAIKGFVIWSNRNSLSNCMFSFTLPLSNFFTSSKREPVIDTKK